MGSEAIPPRRAILFPGQGAQRVGMGQSFHRRSRRARELFERADSLLGIPLTRITFEGPEAELVRTDVCQPAIFVCSAAVVAALEELGILRREEFGCAAGLSLGEYSALWFAGSLTFEDALRTVRARGQAMQEASDRTPSGMAALLGATAEQARALCESCAQGEVLQPANLLGPGNVTISGARGALERAVGAARGAGIRRAALLDVAGAFHSPLMESGRARLERVLGDVRIEAPRIPVYSNVDARPHGAPDSIRVDLARQVTAPVLWETSMRAMLATGVRDFLEPGPGGVLTGLLRKIEPSASCRNIQSVEELGSPASEGASG